MMRVGFAGMFTATPSSSTTVTGNCDTGETMPAGGEDDPGRSVPPDEQPASISGMIRAIAQVVRGRHAGRHEMRTIPPPLGRGRPQQESPRLSPEALCERP